MGLNHVKMSYTNPFDALSDESTVMPENKRRSCFEALEEKKKTAVRINNAKAAEAALINKYEKIVEEYKSQGGTFPRDRWHNHLLAQVNYINSKKHSDYISSLTLSA